MIKVESKTYRKILTTGNKLNRVAGADVARAIGAEPKVSVTRKHSSVALFGLREALATRLESTGGRPSLGLSRRQKIPLADADWELLCKLAQALTDNERHPTPGQVASELLHQRLAQLRPDIEQAAVRLKSAV